MDHYLRPPNSPPIDVPYVCTEDYDGGDFFTYPQRKKWKFNWSESEPEPEPEILKSMFENRPSAEVEDFCQTWLFFGCLIEIFKVVDIKVSTSDFLRDGRYITTAKLPELLNEWHEKEKGTKE